MLYLPLQANLFSDTMAWSINRPTLSPSLGKTFEGRHQRENETSLYAGNLI
jgi:hypothetical protein